MIDGQHLQLVGPWVPLGGEHFGDAEIRQRRGRIGETLHLQSNGGQPIGNRRRIRIGVEMGLEP